MTQKILLAESLDLLRQCEMKEYEVDTLRSRTSNANDLARVVKGYHDVYREYIRGLEMLNFVRHSVLEERNPANPTYNRNMGEFCGNKIAAYMDRCENITRKVDVIVLPGDQADTITKDGFTADTTVYYQDSKQYPITSKEKKVEKVFEVTEGTYVLTIKNRDDYTVMSPSISVHVSVSQPGLGTDNTRLEKLPDKSSWRKFIGVVKTGTVHLTVSTNGMRDSHIDIMLERWRCVDGSLPEDGNANFDPAIGGSTQLDSVAMFENVVKPHSHNDNNVQQQQRPTMPRGGATQAATAGTTNTWVGNLPAIPDDELAALANYNVPQTSLPPPGAAAGGRGVPQQQQQQQQAVDPWSELENMNVPHAARKTSSLVVPDPIEVNPAGLTCQQRMAKVRAMMNAWPEESVGATGLPHAEQNVVSAVYALPLPRELS